MSAAWRRGVPFLQKSGAVQKIDGSTRPFVFFSAARTTVLGAALIPSIHIWRTRV